MIKELIKIANSLDSRGLHKEAEALDEIIREAAGDIESPKKYRRMEMRTWPGLRVSGYNANDIMTQLSKYGPTRRGGEAWAKLSKLGPKMVNRVPQHNTLIYSVDNGVVSLTSVEPSDDPELKTAAEGVVTVLQNAKDKPGPYGKLIFSEGTNVTVTLSTKKIDLQ